MLQTSVPAQESRVITEFLSACFFKLVKQISYSKLFLFFSLNIQDDFSFHHHDQTIAMSNGILHVMGDHKCGQMITINDHFGDLQDLGRCLGVKGSCMLIQKQKFWFL